jgi:MFS family permease
VGWAALSELVPYYPLYALLFLHTGLTEPQISLLFALWSITAFVAEVPTGALADRWSRRGALVLAGGLQATAFVVWTAAPGFVAFAVGFVVWGVGGALMSGTSEALVYDGLAAVGGAGAYVRVHGWMTAVELLVQVPTALLATALFAVGGYPLVGWVSVGICAGAGLLALRFPEAPRVADDEDDAGSLRRGVVAALRRPGLLLVVLAVALIGGLDAVEEYFPVLAADRGVPVTAVPVAILGIALAGAAGAALGGRAGRLRDR